MVEKNVIYEEDTVVLACPDLGNSFFVHALPPACDRNERSSSLTVCEPCEAPNGTIHNYEFQIISAEDDQSWFLHSLVEEHGAKKSYFKSQRLIYGRKIKFQHIVSGLYLTVPVNVTETDLQTGFLSQTPCIFKILPIQKSKGTSVHSEDLVIFETEDYKNNYMLYRHDSSAKQFEVIVSTKSSTFSVCLQSHINESKNIRGGSIVKLIEPLTKSCLCATVDANDENANVYVKKKRSISTTVARPLSSNCWWMLEKVRTEPTLVPMPMALDGKIESGIGGSCIAKHDRFHLRHLSSGKYWCSKDTLGSDEPLVFTYADNTNMSNIRLHLVGNCDNSVIIGKHCFEIDMVDPGSITDFFTVQSVKKCFENEANINLCREVLKELVTWLQKGSDTSRGEMLYNTHVINLIVRKYFLRDAQLEDQKLVSDVLKEMVNVKSRQCQQHVKEFIDVYIEKVGQGIGIENVLLLLAMDDRLIAKKLIDQISGISLFGLNAELLQQLSELCFISGSPDNYFQDYISLCFVTETIFNNTDDITIRVSSAEFYWTHVEPNNQVYYSWTKDGSKKLLCNLTKDSNEFSYFVAQICLFSNICKGINKFSIKVVKTWISFDDAKIILRDTEINPIVKSAYLELVISVYVEEMMSRINIVHIDNVWHCYVWNNLRSNAPLEGANLDHPVRQENNYFQQWIDWVAEEIKKYEVLNAEYLFQLLNAVHLIASHGYCWSVSPQSTIVKFGTGHNPTQLNFKIKSRALSILQIFFKQFMYLSLEKFLFRFHYLCTQVTQRSEICDVNFLNQWNDPNSTMEDRLISEAMQISNIFMFQDDYGYFDVNSDGKELAETLKYLLSNENDELKSSAASLLFDIYNKELIMLSEASFSCLVDEEDEISKAVKNNEFLLNLMQGKAPKNTVHHSKRNTDYVMMAKDAVPTEDTVTGTDIDTIDGESKVNDVVISDVFQNWVSAMVVDNDETNPNEFNQNIAFASGLFSFLLTYVLKFCDKRNYDQLPFLKSSCMVLQKICRKNNKIQSKIFESLTDLLKVKVSVSSIARLITEILTKNSAVCYRITESNIEQIFTLASTLRIWDIVDYEAFAGSGYSEFFTTLEAAIKPFKFSSAPNEIHQTVICQVFLADKFGDIFLKCNVLLKRPNNDIKLLKLLQVSSLLSTCCEGKSKPAGSICRDIFTLDGLLNIIFDENISLVRKIPFARLLVEAYFSDEKNSPLTIKKLKEMKVALAGHIEYIIRRIRSIDFHNEDKEIKATRYMRKVFEYHETWDEILNPELGIDSSHENVIFKDTLFVLRYFVEGFGLIVDTLCKEQLRSKDNICDLSQLGKSILDLLTVYGSVLITTEVQHKFWKSIIVAFNLNLDCDIHGNGNEQQRQSEKMERFQNFVSNCRFAYDRNNTNDLRSCRQLIPRGSTFQQLIDLIYESQDGDSTEIETPDKTIQNLLKVLYNQMDKLQTSKEMVRMESTLLTIFQVLLAFVYRSKGTLKTNIICIQFLVANRNYPLEHLSPGYVIAVHILAFLCALVSHGDYCNEIVQDQLYEVVHSNVSDFFFIIHKLLIATQKKQVKRDIHIPSNQERLSPNFISYQVALPSRPQGRMNVSNILSASHCCRIRIEPDNVMEENEMSQFNSDSIFSYELDDTSLNQASVVLELLSALCDGQNRKLQDVMKEQKLCVTSVDIISAVTALLERLAEMPLECGSVQQIITITDTMTKAIQCLIEMCAGNFLNQKSVAEDQIFDSVNDILKYRSSCFKYSAKRHLNSCDAVLQMQCKTVELLQVLLEETNEKSYSAVILLIINELDIHNIISFTKELYNKVYHAEPSTLRRKVVKRSMFRAFHILKTIADHIGVDHKKFIKKIEKDDDKMWDVLDNETHTVEISYQENILTRVYFPFEWSRALTEDEKNYMQENLNRDSVEDRARDLYKWTKSVLKNDRYRRKLSKYYFWTAVTLLSPVRHWTLILLTIFLNIFVLGIFTMPALTCDIQNDTNVTNTGPVLIPQPWNCWSSHHYAILYFFGSIHTILSAWMILEYLVKEVPNFNFTITFVMNQLYEFKQWSKRQLYLQQLYHSTILSKVAKPRKKNCFEVHFFGFDPFYRILFVLFSFISVGTHGYFYCLCLPYIFLKIDVIRHVVKAIRRRVKQLILMGCLIFSLLLIYAVFAFAIMSSFFNPNNDLFCMTLFECSVTVIRQGLLLGLGTIAVRYNGQMENNFDIYFWRAVIDVIFFFTITTLSLEVITAILVDTFTAVREEKEHALKDQKEKCYVCGRNNEDFEEQGKGFENHYREDHNIYSYIYYALYLDSMDNRDHNAIEKYVYKIIKEKHPRKYFYPYRTAWILQRKSKPSDPVQSIEEVNLLSK